MERTFSLIIFLVAFNLANGQANYRHEIYKSFIRNDMSKWKSVIDEMHRQPNKSNIFLLELTNYQYGYIAWHIGKENYDEAKRYLELAEKNIEKLEQNRYNPSMVNSYKSAFNGFKIGFNRLKAPFLGPQSIEYAELSVKLNNENPCGFIQMGNIQFYMPSAFGGSKQLALEYYKTAEKLMECRMSDFEKNWNYLNLLVVIAQVHTKLKDYKSAKEYYEKILYVEPQFLWAKVQFEKIKQKQEA